MDLHEVLERRASTRAFTPEPVSPATLDRVLRAALASPSWANPQPYRLAVATDVACDALRRELLAATEREIPNGDHLLLFDYPRAHDRLAAAPTLDLCRSLRGVAGRRRSATPR